MLSPGVREVAYGALGVVAEMLSALQRLGPLPVNKRHVRRKKAPLEERLAAEAAQGTPFFVLCVCCCCCWERPWSSFVKNRERGEGCGGC